MIRVVMRISSRHRDEVYSREEEAEREIGPARMIGRCHQNYAVYTAAHKFLAHDRCFGRRGWGVVSEGLE